MIAAHSNTLQRVVYFESANPTVADDAPADLHSPSVELLSLTELCDRGDGHGE